ncbi:MAG TPA: hypothetical protein PLU39_07665 [Armatimonadota bacterium]|nr:hypothetical protein [Armatimonadota bacterium]
MLGDVGLRKRFTDAPILNGVGVLEYATHCGIPELGISCTFEYRRNVCLAGIIEHQAGYRAGQRPIQFLGTKR